MLTLYFDDFKLAGPAPNLKIGWEMICDELDVEKPGGLGLYLGCKHEKEKKIVDGRTVTSLTYNMEDYFASIVRDYEQLSS